MVWYPEVWPLSTSCAWLRCGAKDIRRGARKVQRGAKVTKHGSIQEALGAGAPFSVETRASYLWTELDDQWTVIFSTATPGYELLEYWLAAAQTRHHCDAVAAVVAPQGAQPPENGFALYDYQADRAGRPHVETNLSVHVVKSDEYGWTFSRTGHMREFEDATAYERSRKLERLTVDMVDSYVRACGVTNTSILPENDVYLWKDPSLASRQWSSVSELADKLGYSSTTRGV